MNINESATESFIDSLIDSTTDSFNKSLNHSVGDPLGPSVPDSFSESVSDFFSPSVLDPFSPSILDYLNESVSGLNSSLPVTRDEALARLELATLATIFLLALLGNGCMLMALMRVRSHRRLTRVHYLMLQLSIADLLVAVFNVLPQLAWDATFRFHGPDWLCRAVKFGQVMPLYLSTLVLVTMAVDRYHVIGGASWLRINTPTSLRFLIRLAWITSCLLALPQIIIFSQRKLENGDTDCWAEFGSAWVQKAYITCFVIVIFLLPMTALTLCYTSIAVTIYRLSRYVAENSRQHRNRNSQEPSSRLNSDINQQSLSFGASGGRQLHLTAKMRSDQETVTMTTLRKTSGSTNRKGSSLGSYGSESLRQSRVGRSARRTCSNECIDRVRNSDEKRIVGAVGARSGQGSDNSRDFNGGSASRGKDRGVNPTGRNGARRLAVRRGCERIASGNSDYQTSGNEFHKISQAKVQSLKLTFTVLLCYVVGWAPFCCTQVYVTYFPLAEDSNYPGTLVILLLLASLNACINPWVYFYFSKDVRNQMKEMFRTVRCCCSLQQILSMLLYTDSSLFDSSTATVQLRRDPLHQQRQPEQQQSPPGQAVRLIRSRPARGRDWQRRQMRAKYFGDRVIIVI